MPSEEVSLDQIYLYYQKVTSTHTQPEVLEKIKKHEALTHQSLDLGPSFYGVIDYTNFSYQYISDSVENVLGYKQSLIPEQGFIFFSSVVFKEDQALIAKLWAVITTHSKSLPVDILRNSYYCSDWHIRHREGHRMHMMQQTMKLETDDEGRFIYELIKYTDITHWQKQSPICGILTTPDPQYDLIYFPKKKIQDTGTAILTGRAKGFGISRRR